MKICMAGYLFECALALSSCSIVKQNQRKHLLAAHRIVNKQTDELLEAGAKDDTSSD